MEERAVKVLLGFFLTGCLFLCALSCQAHVKKNHSLQELLQPWEPAAENNPHHFKVKQFKQRLKEMFAYDFNPSVQVGIDRIRSGPLKAEVYDIIDINTHLSENHTQDLTSRGFGIELRIKLD